MASLPAPLRALTRAALSSGDQAEQLAQALPALAVVAAQRPERRHRGSQAQRGGRVVLAVPTERRADVVVLGVDALAIPSSPGLREAASLDQGQEGRGMSAADPGRFRYLVQALGRVLADRLRHQVARR